LRYEASYLEACIEWDDSTPTGIKKFNPTTPILFCVSFLFLLKSKCLECF
jgi:hypothetical protein